MRKEGVIVRWDDAKGFGFIRSGAGAQDVFLHVRDFRGGQAPRQGLRVTFEDIHIGGKGPRAVAVQPFEASGLGSGRVQRARAAPAPLNTVRAGRARSDRHHGTGSAPESGAAMALPLMAAYALALLWLVWQRQLPWWVLPVSFLLNLLTFFAYWQDKYAAQQRRWRIREDTLHFWSLAGGWGGAWWAQQVLRHKSAKASFRSTYWTTVVVHCCGAFGVWWLWSASAGG